ncbi:MAG: hypothetical protein KAT68_17460 [Bacteroidales bacterium]|nr:hypothetical protein [Bacteroidales bacterium]
MKKLYLSLITIFSVILINGQSVSPFFELDEPILPNQTMDMVASEYINMVNNYPELGGFSSKPDDTHFVNARIDPMMVFPPYIGQFGGPPNNNTGGKVGTIPGNLMVTSTGAAVYSIPIEIPPGLADLTPELKFVYNNQAGDGIMGDGWSISGLSKISRVPFTYYFNNFTNSVVLNDIDQLMIDGNYLIKTHNNEYRTEQETFSKIVPIENNIVNGFKVYKKNGLVYYYGHREDARYYLQNYNAPIAWYLARIEDLNKNYIEFYYINDRTEGSFYPDKILYTGNSKTGQDAFYEIKFIYNQNPLDREDTPKKYFATSNKNYGIFSRITRLLQSVKITHIPTGTTIKEYILYYDYKGFFSKKYLTSIYLYPDYNKKKGHYYNPTKFNWFNSDYTIDTKEKELFVAYNDNRIRVQKDIFATNFDNESPSDILICSKSESCNNKLHVRAYLNWSKYYSDHFNFHFCNNIEYEHTFEGNVIFFLSPGDFNGDGIDEIICIYKAPSYYYYTIGYFDFENSGAYVEGPVNYLSSSGSNFEIENCIVSDFSGNGYSDLCIIFNENNTFSKYVFLLSNENEPLTKRIENSNVILEIPKKILTGDFNGNAKTELLVVGNTSSKVISLFTNNESFSAESTTNDFCAINSSIDIVAGDFNSDAKTDVLLLKSGIEENWVFYFSYGKGDFVKTPPITIEGIGSSEKLKYAVDVNGDKYSDICMIYRITNINGIKNYYRKDFLINPKNSGIEVIKKELTEPVTFISNNSDIQEVDFCFGNFSGNSSNQLIASRIFTQGAYNNWYAKIHLSAPIYHSFINAVDKITNGFGKEKKIHYCPFTAVPAYTGERSYSASKTDLEFPVIHYAGILNVVTAYEQEVEQDEFLSVNYYYYGAKYHKIGKGFLGFDKVEQSNELNGTFTIRYFNINNNYFHIVNNKTEIKPITNFYKLISESTNNYKFRDMNDPEHLCYFPYLENSYQKNYDLYGDIVNKYKVDYNNYDNWGNPKEIIEHYGIDNGDSEYPIRKTRTINYKNLTENNMYVIGLIDDITTTFHKDNSSDIVKTIDFEYYENTTALLKSETVEPNDPKSYTIHYIYDDGNETYGNLTEKKLTAAGMENKISSYTYSQDGRFKLSFINPKNHIEEYTYYEKTGLLKTHTDVNQLKTTYEYDKFGRIDKEIYPNGTILKTVRRWTIPGYANEHEDAPSTAYYYLWAKSPCSSEILTFYDQFNRELRKVTTSFDDTKIYEDKEYLGTPTYSGLLWHHSNPYFKNEEPVWTNTIYDIYRRPEIINKPDGSSESYTYSKNTETITGFDGQTKKLEYNGAGWLTKVTDNNEGVINYNHRSDGLVKDITINGLQSTKVSKTYDAFGQTETLTDPDNGTTTYVYNAFSDLISETDELNTITYTPDKLSRIIERIAPDGYTIWQYDTQNFGVGKLHAVAHAPFKGEIHQVIRENVYNNFGYLSEQKQTINGKQIEFNYTYDVFGRQKQLTLPSGYQTTNYYKKNGYLISIRDNNSKSLWEATEMNAWGMVTKSKIGNNINNEHIYDALNGRITDITASTNGSFNNLQNIHYEWKTDGNLDFRQDNIKNLKESFQYDSFNRLKKVFLNNVLQLETGFNTIGNIKTKSDVGTYIYNQNTQPHAVTNITGTPETISSLDQEIEYTSFDKVKHISEGENNKDTYTLNISYGSEHNRVWQKFENNITGETVTKRYFNNIYEKITENNGNQKKLHYLTAPTGLFAIFTIQNDEVENINYILKDHLGSINYILDEDGTVAQEMNFDAWGRLRDAQTWTYNNVPTNFMFDRGFTMHEHLNAFKLINMNGRMYDPVVARFLSPDPFVQMPEYSQNFNRYSYVLNNPLRFTDPSGFIFLENFDWFINNQTGDVYYNSEYREGDESKIEGEGWVWFGENDVFSKDSRFNDYQIILKNSDLLPEIYEKKEYDKSLVFNDAKLVSFNVEATFKGQKALIFMKRQGYDKKPLLADVHTFKQTLRFGECKGPIFITIQDYETFEKVDSWTYIQKGSGSYYDILSYYKPIIKGEDWKTSIYTRETWEKRKYNYILSARTQGKYESLFWDILKIIDWKNLYNKIK